MRKLTSDRQPGVVSGKTGNRRVGQAFEGDGPQQDQDGVMNDWDQNDSGHSTVLPIEEVHDLHTFSPRETRLVVEEYLYRCHLRRFREVCLIHGKGRGVQRGLVHSLLAKSSLVDELKEAPPVLGNYSKD